MGIPIGSNSLELHHRWVPASTWALKPFPLHRLTRPARPPEYLLLHSYAYSQKVVAFSRLLPFLHNFESREKSVGHKVTCFHYPNVISLLVTKIPFDFDTVQTMTISRGIHDAVMKSMLSHVSLQRKLRSLPNQYTRSKCKFNQGGCIFRKLTVHARRVGIVQFPQWSHKNKTISTSRNLGFIDLLTFNGFSVSRVNCKAE